MSATGKKRLHVGEIGGITVIDVLDARIDEQNVQIIGIQLVTLTEVEERRWLILDFSTVDYVTPLMLGSLDILDRMLETRGGQLVLCGVRPQFLEIMEAADFDRRFIITRNKQEAYGHFQ